jgi:5'-nucleotidase (lipoprotein e(P4) family)
VRFRVSPKYRSSNSLECADSLQQATIQNLQQLGFPEVSNETVLSQAPDEIGKDRRRNLVATNYRIVLLMGDSLADLSNAYTGQLEQARNAQVEVDRLQFGRHFIALPNAIYGDWEGALYNNDWTGTPASRAQTRRELVIDDPLSNNIL